MNDDPFVTHRSLLFTVAYEMLGSAADAEDVVQDAWVRWDRMGADGRAEVAGPRAYLVRIVTRLALDRMRAISRRREDYVGQWLPEPLLTSPDVADDVELAENISIAMLTVLETLGPAERAVFVLREVFDLSYDEIGEAVGKSTASVRQIAHRARSHVAARRPRMEVDRAQQLEVVDKFLAAIRGGDMQPLFDVLAPDVVLVGDGGGFIPSAPKPLHGSERMVKVLKSGLDVLARKHGEIRADAAWFNGAPGIRMEFGDQRAAVSLTIEDGLVTRVHAIGNPEKLTRIDDEASLGR